jgi:hypothetical protein
MRRTSANPLLPAEISVAHTRCGNPDCPRQAEVFAFCCDSNGALELAFCLQCATRAGAFSWLEKQAERVTARRRA